MKDTDYHIRLAMQTRRTDILDALATRTFTDEERQSIYSELAELALELGPNEEDQAEAYLYRDLRASLSFIHDLQSDTARIYGLVEREHRRWHPKLEDSHGP